MKREVKVVTMIMVINLIFSMGMKGDNKDNIKIKETIITMGEMKREEKAKEKNRVQWIKKGIRKTGIKILDKKGRIKKTIQKAYKERKDGYNEVKIIESNRGKYFAVIEKELKENPEDIYYKTGWKWSIKEKVILYDAEGNSKVVREKLKDCDVVAISDNGYIVCGRTLPVVEEELIGVKEEIRKKMKGYILVISKEGDIVYKINENYFDLGSIKISPMGKWIAWLTDTEDNIECIKIVNLKDKRTYNILINNKNIIIKSFTSVTDEGELYTTQDILKRSKNNKNKWEKAGYKKIKLFKIDTRHEEKMK